VISLNIAKCKDPWVEWRPLRDRAEMMLDLTLRGLVRNPLLAENASNGAPENSSPIAKNAKDGAPGAYETPDLPTEEK
jgi:hypothetical protein